MPEAWPTPGHAVTCISDLTEKAEENRCQNQDT